MDVVMPGPRSIRVQDVARNQVHVRIPAVAGVTETIHTGGEMIISFPFRIKAGRKYIIY